MNQMYILYIALFGLLIVDGVNGFFVYKSGYMNKIQQRGEIYMRTKRNKAIDNSYGDRGGDEGNIVASLATGGGWSSNYRAISPVYSPRTINQKTYVKYLGEHDTKIVLGVGAAGSGKTLFACYTAIQELRRGAISKIIITRPVVPVEEEEIGFLPGSLINKMDPWTRPIFDILLEFYAQKDIDAMLHGGVIEISPLAFMRGRTFKRAFIIADEMQNSSPNQMLMLTTRLGEGSKMVITGDLKQSDRGVNNGLHDLLRKLKVYETRPMCSSSNNSSVAIKYVELETDDVQRSPIVSKMLDIYGGAIPLHKPFSEPLVPSTCNVSNATFSDVAKAVHREVKKTVIKVVNETLYTQPSTPPLFDLADAALIPLHHISKRLRK